MRRPVVLAVPFLLILALVAGCNDDGGSSVVDSSVADDGGTTDGGAATATGGDTATDGTEAPETDDDGGTTDGGDDGDATTDDGGEPTDDPRTDEERAADEAAASSALLTLEDMGPGWDTEARDDDEESQEGFNQQMAECIGVDPGLLNRDNPSAQSNDFVNAAQQVVNNEITYAAAEEDAAMVIDMLQRPETPDCFGQAVDQLLQENLAELQAESGPVEIGTPTVEALELPELGDGSAGLSLTVPITSPEGQELELFIDSYAVQVGRAGVELQTQSAGLPFDPAEAQRLLELVVDRVATA